MSGGFAEPGRADWAQPAPAAGPGERQPAAGMAPLLPPRTEATSRAWRAMLLGLVGAIGGIVFGWTAPVAVAGIVLGARALRGADRDGRRLAVAGIVLGGAGLVLSAGWLVYSLVTILAAPGA